MNNQDKKEILKSVENALGEGGTIILACDSPADKNMTYVTVGEELRIAMILAFRMLADEDFARIIAKAARTYTHFKKAERC